MKVACRIHRALGALVPAFLVCSLWANRASAEVEVLEKGDWTLSLSGRFNAFMSYGWGDSYPSDPEDGSYNIIGGGGLETSKQDKVDKTFAGTRIRSGFLGNTFGVSLKRKIDATSTAQGYMSIWSTIETNRSRYFPTLADVREGYLKLEGPWGSFLAGRALGLFSRGSVEINYEYAHNFGLGFPCNIQGTGPTCGHIGFGVLFPFFAAGGLYTTPSIGGVTLAVGLYDPVQLAGKWERTTWPRAEAELAWGLPLGELGKFKVFTTAVWQELARRAEPGDINAEKTVAVKGIAGGGRIELGPVRLGVAGHYGPGLGFSYALENSQAGYYFDEADSKDGDLRTFDGYYAQAALVLGKVDLAAGYGASRLHRFSFDPPELDLPQQQVGISGGVFYHHRDYLVFGLDYFRANYSLYYGETQQVNFVNMGVTLLY